MIISPNPCEGRERTVIGAALSFPSKLRSPPFNDLLDICGYYAFFQIIYLFSYFYLSVPYDFFCHWLPCIANVPRTIPIEVLSHKKKSEVENEGGVLALHP